MAGNRSIRSLLGKRAQGKPVKIHPRLLSEFMTELSNRRPPGKRGGPGAPRTVQHNPLKKGCRCVDCRIKKGWAPYTKIEVF